MPRRYHPPDSTTHCFSEATHTCCPLSGPNSLSSNSESGEESASGSGNSPAAGGTTGVSSRPNGSSAFASSDVLPPCPLLLSRSLLVSGMQGTQSEEDAVQGGGEGLPSEGHAAACLLSATGEAMNSLCCGIPPTADGSTFGGSLVPLAAEAISEPTLPPSLAVCCEPSLKPTVAASLVRGLPGSPCSGSVCCEAVPEPPSPAPQAVGLPGSPLGGGIVCCEPAWGKAVSGGYPVSTDAGVEISRCEASELSAVA